MTTVEIKLLPLIVLLLAVGAAALTTAGFILSGAHTDLAIHVGPEGAARLEAVLTALGVNT